MVTLTWCGNELKTQFKFVHVSIILFCKTWNWNGHIFFFFCFFFFVSLFFFFFYYFFLCFFAFFLFLCFCFCFVLFFFIAGSREERGLEAFHKQAAEEHSDPDGPSNTIYDIPLLRGCLNRLPRWSFLSFLPAVLKASDVNKSQNGEVENSLQSHNEYVPLNFKQMNLENKAT